MGQIVDTCCGLRHKDHITELADRIEELEYIYQELFVNNCGCNGSMPNTMFNKRK